MARFFSAHRVKGTFPSVDGLVEMCDFRSVVQAFAVCLMVFCLGPVAFCAPVAVPAPPPLVKLLSDRENMPLGGATALATDDKGYVWAGTSKGPMRYNGRAWVSAVPPLKGVAIQGLLASVDGGLWLASESGGVSYWREGRLKQFAEEPLAPKQCVNAMLYSPGRGVLFGAGDCVFHYRSGQWGQLPLGRRLQVKALCEVQEGEGEGTLWVGTDAGLGSYRYGLWRWYGREAGLPEGPIESLLSYRDGEGQPTMWVGTRQGLFRWRQNRAQCVPETAGRSVVHLAVSLTKSGERRLWLGTDQGLMRGEKDQWKKLDDKEGVPALAVQSLLVHNLPNDHEMVWMGTMPGVFKMEPGDWLHLKQPDVAMDRAVTALAEDRHDGGFWLGTAGRGLLRYHQGACQRFESASKTADGYVTALLADSTDKGGLWVGTASQGLFHRQGQREVGYGIGQGLPDPHIHCLCQVLEDEKKAGVWVGTSLGPAQFKQGHFRLPDPLQKMPWGPVSAMLSGKDGEGSVCLWFAVEGKGVVEWQENRLQRFEAHQGLPSEKYFCLMRHVDQQGVPWLWVGGMGGAYRMRLSGMDRRWESVCVLHGVSVYGLVTREKDQIYAATDRGIWSLRPTEASGKGWESYRYTVDAGLPSNWCMPGSILLDSVGRLCVGTSQGAALLVASHGPLLPGLGKPLVFEAITFSGQPWDGRQSIVLPWKKPALSVQYALLSHSRESSIRYRSQMDGLEETPTPWDTAFSRTFSPLSPGRYTFHVWAQDGTGAMSGPLSLSIVVPAPPYLRDWAWGLYGILGAGLASGGYWRWRGFWRRHKQKLCEHLRKRQREKREALSQREQATKQSQVMEAKAFFVSMALRQGMHQSLKEMRRLAKAITLHPVSTEEGVLAESILEINENVFGTLNEVLEFAQAIETPHRQVDFDPVLETENGLASFAEMSHKKGVNLVGYFEPELPQWVHGDLASFRQVVVHLLTHAIRLTRHGEVRLRLGLSSGLISDAENEVCALCLEVTDTGLGLPAHALQRCLTLEMEGLSKSEDLDDGTVGLILCHHIVKRLGGVFQVDSEVGKGSHFRCDVPLGRPQTESVRVACPDFRQCKVIVYDQNDATLRALANDLRSWNARPVLAAHVEELRLCLEGGLTGLDAKALILGLGVKERDPEPLYRMVSAYGLPMLFLGGSAAIGKGERLCPQNKVMFLMKPVRRAKMISVLESLLLPHAPLEHVALDQHVWDGLRYLEEVSGPGAIEEVVMGFSRDVPTRLDRMGLALSSGDLMALERLSHDFKSNVASLGLSHLAHLGERIEHEAKSGDYVRLDELLRTCRSMLPAALEAVRARARMEG